MTARIVLEGGPCDGQALPAVSPPLTVHFMRTMQMVEAFDTGAQNLPTMTGSYWPARPERTVDIDGDPHEVWSFVGTYSEQGDISQ